MIISLKNAFFLSVLMTTSHGQKLNGSVEYFNTEHVDIISSEERNSTIDDNTNVNLNTALENPVDSDSKNAEGDIEGYAAMIDIRDEVSLEDEALILAHIDSDIEDFEDLKKTIAFLEKSIRKHADTHVVNSKELIEANKVLKKLDDKMVTSYEQELKSLKSQISKLGHKYNNASINEIATIVENAEMFLQISMDKIDELEMIEHEWEVAEESSKVQNMIEEDETMQYGSKIILEALKQASVDGDKFHSKKLNVVDQSTTTASPTSIKSIMIKLDGDSMYEKLKKFNTMKKSKNKEITDGVLKEVPSEVVSSNIGNPNEGSETNDSNEGGIQLESESDEGEVLDSDDGIIESEPIDNILIGNTENLKMGMTGKSFKSYGDKELVSASHDEHKSKGKYYVEHYSSKVKEALNIAKEMSHEFMDNNLGQEKESGETGTEQASVT